MIPRLSSGAAARAAYHWAALGAFFTAALRLAIETWRRHYRVPAWAYGIALVVGVGAAGAESLSARTLTSSTARRSTASSWGAW